MSKKNLKAWVDGEPSLWGPEGRIKGQSGAEGELLQYIEGGSHVQKVKRRCRSVVLGMRCFKQYALAASVAFEHFCRSYIFVPTVFFTSNMFSSFALRFLFLLSASICTRLCVIFAWTRCKKQTSLKKYLKKITENGRDSLQRWGLCWPGVLSPI